MVGNEVNVVVAVCKKGVMERAIGEGGIVEDWTGGVFIKFSWEVIWHAWSLVPKSAAGLVATTILQDDGMPPLPHGVI